jgi:hypothetical protein
MPTDAATYAEKLKEEDFDDYLRVYTEITETGQLPDGFFITGLVQDQGAPDSPPGLGLVMVRRVDGLRIRCKGSNLADEAIRTEAMEIFKSAGF